MAKSLLALANEAATMTERGLAQAERFIESTELSPGQMGDIQRMATVNKDAADALDELADAKTAVFYDPIARHAYWTKRIASLAEDAKPEPVEVLKCLYAGQATWMPTRNRAETQRPAIPLFCLWQKHADAMLRCGNVQGGPLILPRVHRAAWNTSSAHIGSYGNGFLAPWTVNDLQAFTDFKGTLGRSMDYLTEQLDGGKKMSLREAVWLACNLTPCARLMPKKLFERDFDGETAVVKHKRFGEYMHVEVSVREHFVAPKNELSERLFEQLLALAES